MSDKSSESGLLKLWQRIAGGITAITGFIAGLLGFIQLVQGNAGLATTLLLIVGIGLLWVACLYYARFWKPEAKDQGPAKPSSFLPDEERRQYELELKKFQGQQARRQTRRKMIRRSALIGVIIIPLLLLAGFLTWQQVQNLPTKEVVILVAEFDGPEPQNYRVTETILSNLRDETETHDDVKIATLDQPITEQDGSDTARAAGEEQRATIVIWGWYGKTAETVPISVNFEVLNPPEYLPKIGETARGEVQTFALGELDSFQLQTRLSAEMVYLTLFTLGMARYAAEDWHGAIKFFTDALNQVDESATALDQSSVYFYRGNSQYLQNNFEQAIADLSQALQLDPEYASAYNNRGNAHYNKGNYEQAIDDLSRALQIDPEYAVAYYNRGNAHSVQGNYEQAIDDYNQAIQLDPEYAIAYNNRGNAHSDQGDYEQAIDDYNQALQIDPEYAVAYYNRGNAHSDQGDYEQAIDDYNQAI
ncbi:MAG: tetratricopeptide repeat protein, partial [Cyanobacteria bacterium J06635_15]